MDNFIGRKLQAALPPTVITMQLPAPATISALPPTPAPYHKDVDDAAQLTLAPS